MLTANQRRRRAHLALAAVVSVLTLGATILPAFPPEQYSFYPRCPFYELTGLLCPGCGATHALAALTHGNLPGALHANALVVLLLPLLAAYGLHAYRQAVTASPTRRIPIPAIALALTIAFVFALFRNLA